MDRAVSISIGEVLHDHFGEYRTIKSGDVQSEVIDNQILKDTMVGENADDNIIVNMGLTDKSPYLWVCYNSRESEDGTSFGRSHAIYTDCSWDALYLFNALLNYQFADSVLSHKIASGEMAIPERRIIDLSGVNNEIIAIDSGLLSAMIPYMLKKRRNRFSNFLYIIVPDSVTDYQRYCIAAITTIFNSIPLGLRKQFKVATNAAEDNEENYHILFCRESVFSRREKKGNAVYLDSSDIPKFMQSDVKNDSFTGFIQACVANPQYSENDCITECYDEMEKYKTSILSLGEDDYIAFFDNKGLCLGLQGGNITSELLKRCNEKLESDITENEKEMLKEDICLAIPDVTVMEKAIDEAAEQPNTFDELFSILNQYRNVISCLQEKNIFLSQDFMWDKLYSLRKNIEDTYVSTVPQSAKAKELCELLTLKEELEINKTNFDLFFGVDAIGSYCNNIDESIKKCTSEYQQECENFLANNERMFEDGGSADLLRGLCDSINNSYPELMRRFLNDVMVKITQNQDKYAGRICQLVDIIKKYGNKEVINPELCKSCEDEIIRYIFNNRVSENDIDSYIGWVSENLGNDQVNAFRRVLVSIFTQMCKNAVNGKGGWCSQVGINDIPFKKYSSYSMELRGAIDELIMKNIKEEIKQIIESSGAQTVGELNNSLQIAERYISGNTEFQAEMADTLFEGLQFYYNRSDVNNSQKKQVLNCLWNFMNAHCVVTPYMKKWYNEHAGESETRQGVNYGSERMGEHSYEQTNSRSRENRNNFRSSIRKDNIKNFTSYLYVCKNNPDLIRANDKDNIRKSVINNYIDTKNETMGADYSVSQFMAAVLLAEDDDIQKLIESGKNEFNLDIQMYCEEFNGFFRKEPIPIVISEKSGITEILDEVRSFAYLRQRDDDVVVRYFDQKNKSNDIVLGVSQLSYIIDDVNFIRNGIGEADERFDNREIKSADYYNIWELLIDLGIIKESDILKLEKHYGNKKTPDNIERIIKHYDSRKRKSSILPILKIVLAALIALVLLGSGFFIGYKVGGVKSSKNNDETEDAMEGFSSDNIGIPINTDKPDSPIDKDENSVDTTKINSDSSENDGTGSEENDWDATGKSESDVDNSENLDETDSYDTNTDTSSTDNGLSSNASNSSETNEYDNSNDENGVTSSDVTNENVAYAKINTTYSKVKIYSAMQESKDYVIACIQKREDVTVIICDEDYSADSGNEWVMIQFRDDYTDTENRTVQKGTEAYVFNDYLIPIE